MRHSSRIRLRWAVAATAAAAAVLVGAPAYAHTELIGSDPKKGSTVTTAVTAVTLTFSEQVPQQKTVVTVLGADGASYSEGTPRSVDANVIQNVRPLPTGPIRVTWQTVASDGDTVRGEFTFTNQYVPPTTPPPTTAAATPTGPPSLTPAAAAADSHDDSTLSGWWIAVAIALVAAAAGGIFVARARRRGTAGD